MPRRFALVLLGLLVTAPVWADAPTAEQKKATVAYLQSLQKDSGGFAADAGDATQASLPATSGAIRALKYLGGQVKDPAGAAKFVKSCHDKASGGFAATPGGKPEVRTTAIGIMAVLELKMPVEEYGPGALSYLTENAKSFEDIRIAAAGFEALKADAPKAKEWIAAIEKTRNDDGSYGKGDGMARDTGSAAAAILRLGGTIANKDKVIDVLKSGQRKDGAWGKERAPSDLESTYRVMRALMMMKEKPNIAACRKFIAACRTNDGSYRVMAFPATAAAIPPPGNVSATYYAVIVSKWMDEMK